MRSIITDLFKPMICSVFNGCYPYSLLLLTPSTFNAKALSSNRRSPGVYNRLLHLTLETVAGLEPAFITHLLYLAKGDAAVYHLCQMVPFIISFQSCPMSGCYCYLAYNNLLPTRPFGCELRLPRN